MQNNTYRKDLQGLRAIAVALVVAAHAGIPGIAGGFVGVDVFFVLSGYLISGLLAEEYTRYGRIALGNFYARRLRRLLPAMMVMIAGTVAAATWLLSTSVAYPMLASTPFAASWTSNLFFAFRALDYFNELGARDIFLHTWSLGVEEQFYLIWPFIIAGVLWFSVRGRESARRMWLLSGVVVFGLIGCIVWTDVAPIQAFYLTPARIWQFALGGFVFFSVGHLPFKLTNRLSLLMLFAGLGAIAASAVLFDTQITYPGARAIVPSLGAALIIAAGCSPCPGKWNNPLSEKRLVWIGDRSYSIYLWHWPVLTIGGGLGFNSSATEVCSLLLLVMFLSMLSYRFVELPFWKGGLSNFAPRSALIAGLIVVGVTFASSLQALKVLRSFDGKESGIAYSIRMNKPEIYNLRCDDAFYHSRVEPCIFDGGNATRSAIFIGDSIGAQWVSAFPELFPPPEWRLAILTKSACPMVDEEIFYSHIGAIYTVCSEWRDAALDWIKQSQPDVVLVGSAMSYKYDTTQWINGSQRIFKALSQSAKQVFVIGGTPQLGIDGPGCIARALENNVSSFEKVCRGKPVKTRVKEVLDYQMEAARPFDNVTVLDLTDVVCPNGVCSAVSEDGVPVFRDSQHLTDTFVRSRIGEFRGVMNSATIP